MTNSNSRGMLACVAEVFDDKCSWPSYVARCRGALSDPRLAAGYEISITMPTFPVLKFPSDVVVNACPNGPRCAD
jgi:hypothetical protein